MADVRPASLMALDRIDITNRWVVSVKSAKYTNSVNMKPSPAKSQTLQILSSILSCYPVASRPVVKLGLLNLDARDRIFQTIPCQEKIKVNILVVHDEI